jgi:hypothetical protein
MGLTQVMVNIRPHRMRLVSEARNGLNALTADAEEGLSTHVVKGSTVVAHIVPPNTPVLDDQNLRLAMVFALAERETAAVGESEWREGRLWHAGDSMGRLLAWTLRADPELFMRSFAHFHAMLKCGRANSRAGRNVGRGEHRPSGEPEPQQNCRGVQVSRPPL